MTDYVKKTDDDGEAAKCFCCGYAAATYAFDDERHRGHKMELCEVCSSTHLSTSVQYPDSVSYELRKLFGAVGWIANKLLDEIKDRNSEKA